jgi:hypothetical protein
MLFLAMLLTSATLTRSVRASAKSQENVRGNLVEEDRLNPQLPPLNKKI